MKIAAGVMLWAAFYIADSHCSIRLVDSSVSRPVGRRSPLKHMLAHSCIADGVTPVDQLFLDIVLYGGEPSRCFRKCRGVLEGTHQRVLQLIVQDVGANPPVRAVTHTQLVQLDNRTRAQANN